MGRPKCPNHGCELDPTDNKRVGICPISGYHFQVDIDDKGGLVSKDKFGRIMQEFIVTPLDGEGG